MSAVTGQSRMEGVETPPVLHYYQLLLFKSVEIGVRNADWLLETAATLYSALSNKGCRVGAEQDHDAILQYVLLVHSFTNEVESGCQEHCCVKSMSFGRLSLQCDRHKFVRSLLRVYMGFIIIAPGWTSMRLILPMPLYTNSSENRAQRYSQVPTSPSPTLPLLQSTP